VWRVWANAWVGCASASAQWGGLGGLVAGSMFEFGVGVDSVVDPEILTCEPLLLQFFGPGGRRRR